jgi:hypothetical protein
MFDQEIRASFIKRREKNVRPISGSGRPARDVLFRKFQPPKHGQLSLAGIGTLALIGRFGCIGLTSFSERKVWILRALAPDAWRHRPIAWPDQAAVVIDASLRNNVAGRAVSHGKGLNIPCPADHSMTCPSRPGARGCAFLINQVLPICLPPEKSTKRRESSAYMGVLQKLKEFYSKI